MGAVRGHAEARRFAVPAVRAAMTSHSITEEGKQRTVRVKRVKEMHGKENARKGKERK